VFYDETAGGVCDRFKDLHTFALKTRSSHEGEKIAGVNYLPLLHLIATLSATLRAQTTSNPANIPQRDGSHNFDFLIGNWKAHVRRLPDRLNNSTIWIEYEGISNHKKLLDSNANFEEFDVTSTDKKLHIKAQTLRLYNPTSRQWSIYLVDVDNGTLGLPPVVGRLNISPNSARMEQSFSPDGGENLGSEVDLRAFSIANGL